MSQAERIFFLPKTSPELYGHFSFDSRRAAPPVSLYSQMKAHFLSPFIPSVDVTRFAMRQVESFYYKDGIKKYSSPSPLIDIAHDISKSAKNYRAMNEHDAITTYISKRSDLISDISFGVVFFNRGTDYIRREDSAIDLILRQINIAATEPHILPRRRIQFI